MKKLVLSIFTIVLSLSAFVGHAQSNPNEFLDDIVTFSNDIKSEVNITENALNSLAVSYFVLNNTNADVTAYMNAMHASMDRVETSNEEIAYSLYEAVDLNENIDEDVTIDFTQDVEGYENWIRNESNNLKNAIQANNSTAALTSLQLIRAYLNDMEGTSDDIITEAQSNYSVNVRVEIVDNGNVITPQYLTLFWAQDQATNTYVYPNSQSQYSYNLFYNLPSGKTYMFGVQDGYFDGASSVVVTVDHNNADADGFVTVQLNYWSE